MPPLACETETASPLPSPPLSLISDPKIQNTLRAMSSYICVETPFKVDSLEAMLWDHPNQPFVCSVMKGLREGFWPFDDGDWDSWDEELIDNYLTEKKDLVAIREFQDKETKACRWSDPISINEFPPGIKLSPLFVVWQKGKPRVVTDHMVSSLNDGIPKSEAKVRYDNMRMFGQVLYNAKRQYPSDTLVTWKSDVSSAFLNLPAHPLWQLRQLVNVEGVWRIVHCLVFGNRASPCC